MVTCHDIAQYFIWLANKTDSYINNLKLQALVYYAQAWHLAMSGTPLFEEDFEAWIHLPIIPSLFERYRHFSWEPIVENVEQPDLSSSIVAFLEEVAEVYFARDADELELMVRSEEPWIAARGELLIDEPSHAIISKNSLKNYYQNRVKEKV